MGSGSFFKVVLKNFDILAGLPFWPFVKLIFNCWLVLPYFSGGAYVYQHYVRPLFVNQQTVNIWYVPWKKDIFSRPDDVLLAAEKFIEENGPGEFKKLIKKAEKGPKPTEKVPKPRNTNRRVTFDDVEVEKISKAQKSNNQSIFDSCSNHAIFDNSNDHPIYDEVEGERESKSWSNRSFMILGDDYRY